MITLIKSIYSSFVLRQPVLVCLLMAILLGFFAMQTKDFKLDASADSLLLEDDKDETAKCVSDCFRSRRSFSQDKVDDDVITHNLTIGQEGKYGCISQQFNKINDATKRSQRGRSSRNIDKYNDCHSGNHKATKQG